MEFTISYGFAIYTMQDNCIYRQYPHIYVQCFSYRYSDSLHARTICNVRVFRACVCLFIPLVHAYTTLCTPVPALCTSIHDTMYICTGPYVHVFRPLVCSYSTTCTVGQVHPIAHTGRLEIDNKG